MTTPAWLWLAFTIAAAATQTARNAAQRGLTAQLGTMGATHVRFLFGLPFGLTFLAVTWGVVGLDGLSLNAAFAGWAFAGAVFQIAGTALMLAAMRERAFVVAIAYVKTEPVQLALLGLVFLGERLSAMATGAVALATLGVMLMSLPAARGAGGALERSSAASLRPTLMGIASGGMFALSVIGFRGAILALGDGPFYTRATVTLAVTLFVQTALLTAWLLARQPGVLREIFRAWRPSVVAGLAGAAASQLWFFAFALQSPAAVRTVALIEILFAQMASRRLFQQRLARREVAGIALMLAGVVLLTNTT